jgi:hypothetical protein
MGFPEFATGWIATAKNPVKCLFHRFARECGPHLSQPPAQEWRSPPGGSLALSRRKTTSPGDPMEQRFSVNARCPQCGGEQFIKPNDPKPDDDVACNGCGAHWRFDEFQRMGVEQANKLGMDALRDAFTKR